VPSVAHPGFSTTLTDVTATGALAAEKTMGDAPWPGTSALYYAEITLTAPAEEGRHRWEVRVPPLETEPPHAEGRARFLVRTVPKPQVAVRVEAVDQKTQAPIPGARIIMRPYSAVADERGMAELRVAKGDYRIYAKARGVDFR
jgi:hypothetical protein